MPAYPAKQSGEISEYMLYFNTGALMAFMFSQSGGRHAVIQTSRTVLPGSKSGIKSPFEMAVLFQGAARA
jgi:hypothetical protein